MGTKNPIDMDEMSATQPINIGKTAPPTMDIIRNDDPFLVCGPRSFIARAKIVGNIMDIKKKIRNNATTETIPSPALTTGNNNTHISEYIANNFTGATKRIIQLPDKRPIKNSDIPPNPKR